MPVGTSVCKMFKVSYRVIWCPSSYHLMHSFFLSASKMSLHQIKPSLGFHFCHFARSHQALENSSDSPQMLWDAVNWCRNEGVRWDAGTSSAGWSSALYSIYMKVVHVSHRGVELLDEILALEKTVEVLLVALVGPTAVCTHTLIQAPCFS